MSQIPSAASRRARRERDRYPRCPVCATVDVSGLHVDVCERREQLWLVAAEAIDAGGVPRVTGQDLWAHLNTRYGPVMATQLVEVLVDLGWRPVVGSDPARLWSAVPADPETRDRDNHQEQP